MNLAKRSLFAALSCAFSFLLPAQNIQISYTKCDSLFVCNSDTFTVKVQNNFATPLSGASLTMALPAGLTYVPGTVQGAGQLNIFNLSAPVFSLSDIAAGQSATVKVLLSADCAAADVLDAGQLFIANISVASPLGNAQVSTSSIPVETGAIVIQSVTGALLSGEKGDTLLRTICVKNTRLGKIGNLHFEDAHLEGFDASVSGANNPSNGLQLFTADFDGSFFSSTGNGDQWLDLNESVCFTERIILTSCGSPAFTNSSILRVGWGCGSTVCRYDSSFAFIEIKPSTKIPDLVFEQIWAPPTDYCGTTPAVMGFKIKNIGKADAKEIFFNVILTEGLSQVAMGQHSFRIVNSSSVTPITANVSTPTTVGCGLQEIREGSFVIPLVPAKDSIQFLFDVLTCVAQCDQVQPAFRGEYFFKKDCPVNGFVSGSALILPEDNYVVRGTPKVSINECLQSGHTYPFRYVFESEYLKEDGFAHFRLELPHGLTFNDSCLVSVGGIPPALQEITPLADGRSVVHLAWSTPLASDSISIDYCLRYDCDTMLTCSSPLQTPQGGGGVIYNSNCGLSCFLRVVTQVYWSPALQTPQQCAINDCDSMFLMIRLSCFTEDPGDPGDTTQFDPIIPMAGLRTWWNAYRLNYGFLDANDDRHADSQAKGYLPQTRRDRFLAGDTLRMEYCGVIDSGVFNYPIGRTMWHEIVSGDMGQNGNDAFPVQAGQNSFVDNEKFRFLRDSIFVRYADGTTAGCMLDDLLDSLDKQYFVVYQANVYPLTPLDEIVTQRHRFYFKLEDLFSGGCLPKPELAVGDSIFLYTDYKIDLNFKPGSNNDPDPPLVGFRAALSPGGNLYAWNVQPRKYLQYSGWKKYISGNTHSIKPCENSVEVKRFRYSIRIARENMFPFEVRPLANISDYRQTEPAGLELAFAKLEYLTLQDSVSFLSNLNLPFSETPGFLHLDFSPAFAQPVDEGFTLRTNLGFKPDCRFNTPDTSKQYIETSFEGCLNGMNSPILDSLKNPIGFYSNTPNLNLLTADSIVYAPTRDFEIDFDLKNLVVPGAPAAWVDIQSPSGQAGDFELYNMPQNQAITGVNGLFNLGTIVGFSQRSFRLKGQNLACETDSMLIIYGWGCAPISSLADADCGSDSFWIELHLERPELELDILEEPASLTLCDTSDWFVFEVYNAKIGYAYDLEASVKLPSGLRIVPGSCQISYPDGAPWTNIADPALLGGNLFQWQINSVLPPLAANGLPGVNLEPQNTFLIRFKTLAECGFVSNTPIIYGTTGIEPCGRQANVLNKPGEPLNILGLNPTYGVQISTSLLGNPGVACGAAQQLSVSLSILGTPAVGDSVYILLPQGVSYTANSYTPGLNAPAGPPTLTPQGIQLPLPILPGGGTMQFTFSVDLGASAGCNDQIILAQTRVRSEAFCQSLGAPCEVYISTGEGSWNISPAHAQLTAGNIQLSITNGLVDGSVTVTNIGTVAAGSASVQIWRDVDGNGQLSASDVLLQTLQTASGIAAGASVQVSGPLAGLDSTQLCGLLFVLPADENCTCDTQVIPVEDIDLEHTALVYCELKPVTLGVPGQSGFNYQWQPSTGLACATCPSTLYTPDPNSPPNTPQTLTLVQSSSGCTVTHTFQVTFGALAEIISNNAIVCEGKTATLTANPAGATYIWQGPGIQNPAQQTQTVQPLANSTYTVVVSFSNGCTASDTAEIEVLPSDTIQLTGLSTCAGEPVSVLGTMTATAGTYQLVLPKSNGCDSTLLQSLTVLPKFMSEEQRIFCAGDSLEVYDSLFTQSGSISQTFTALNGCDSTHVVTVIEKDPPILVPVDTIFGTYGQIITLNGPNGFITYVWEPMPTPPCPNCPTVTYVADSTGYHEYLLTVTGADGCPGALIYRLVVFPPCSADSLDIPNAFTPNGDGNNDVFRVVKHEGAEVVSSLEIYDRWGQKVYENQGDAFWDGTIDGQPGPSDVYVYIVKVTCGELVGKRVGDVTLLR